MFDLREYQSVIVDRTRNAFRTNRRVLIVAPTGSGKAVILAYVAYHAALKGNRIYLIVHRGELMDQLSGTLREMDVRHGRIQPGWPASDWPVQIAMVATLTRRLHKYPAPELLFFDEAHHVVAASYQKIADYWPNAKILGATATPLRLDGRGLGKAFDAMVEGPRTRNLIDDGWLADFDYLAPPVRIDFSSVAVRMGDYAVDQLAAATDKATITGDVIDHYRNHLDGRPAIAFCVRVDHAEHVAEQAAAAGIKSVSVDGNTPEPERKARISGLGNGNTELLTACDLISEGLDIPAVAGALLLRRTKSLAMFLQWIGRTLRTKRDGSKAVILDHAGNIHEHGLPDAPRRWTLDDKKRKDQTPSVHTCERCYRVFAGGPSWRDNQACDYFMQDGCILNPDESMTGGGGRAEPEVVDGTLQPFTRTPPWAGGIDIVLASGPEYRAMMEHADTYAKVEEIRKARGYSPFWTRHVMKSREQPKKAKFG